MTLEACLSCHLAKSCTLPALPCRWVGSKGTSLWNYWGSLQLPCPLLTIFKMSDAEFTEIASNGRHYSDKHTVLSPVAVCRISQR